MNVIEIDGTRYLKAVDAAKEVGYTTDYVGQLARAGKIVAKQVGRAWYVRENDLILHKQENLRSNKEKTKNDLRRSLVREKEHRIYNTFYTPPHNTLSDFQRRLLDTTVKYEPDTHTLTPSVLKEEKVAAEPRSEYIKHISVFDTEEKSSEAKAPRFLSVKEKSKHVFLTPEREAEPSMKGEVALVDLNEYSDELEKTTAPEREFSSRDFLLSHKERLEKREATVFSPIKDHELTFRNEISLADVPVISLGKRRVTSIALPIVTTLAPLLLFLLLAFSASGLLLQKVVVYQQAEVISADPYYQTYYNLSNPSTLKEKLSRLNDIYRYFNIK